MIRIAITAALIFLIAQNRQQRTHPYVPPLTHVPELSMDLLGAPPAQPRFMLKELCQISSCKQGLLSRHEQLLLNGKEIRLRMQTLSAEIVESEPMLDLTDVLQHRPLAEQSIGELSAWKTVPKLEQGPK